MLHCPQCLLLLVCIVCYLPRLGIPIFGSNFWDPHRKRNSDSVFNSKDSGWKIFFEFRCLESQKIGIPIPKFGIPVPHKKTDAYYSIDTKVHGRNHRHTRRWENYFSRQTYIYSLLLEKEPTSTHT
jgi:hypothetical protein